ncbi:MAG: ParB/RepB/Spo0J family partition protein [Verrucomicrobiales bacterium]
MKEKIILIPIATIRVVNPRVRDKNKFSKVVESIRNVGLKKPIQVTPRKSPQDAPLVYDLICGQGRMEAFQALGLTEIPAIVMNVSGEEALLMSLIENMARRNASPLELIDEIVRLKSCGYSNVAIGKKLDVSDSTVGDLLLLNRAGEGRLIYEVVKGNIPLGIAIDIAKVDGIDQQREFLEAYQQNHLNHAAIRTIRRVMVQRGIFGKNLGDTPSKKSCKSADGLINTLKKEGQRQRLLIKKANICDARVTFIVEALRRLCGDEDFMTLLRAEGINTMPKELSDLINVTESKSH